MTDLERIGDEAVNVAERAEEAADRSELPQPHIDLPVMSQLAASMLHDALDAFVEEDADKARDVLLRDDQVDDYYGRILLNSVEYMSTHSKRIRAGMGVASCAKYLERIADHATNIAEMVVYLVRGVDVRHKGNV